MLIIAFVEQVEDIYINNHYHHRHHFDDIKSLLHRLTMVPENQIFID